MTLLEKLDWLFEILWHSSTNVMLKVEWKDQSNTAEVEIMAGRKYGAITIWSWCRDLNIAETTFLKKS